MHALLGEEMKWQSYFLFCYLTGEGGGGGEGFAFP